MSEESATDVVQRLLDGPEGNGWSCDFASEVDLISEAALTIERLRERVDRLEWALLHPTTADAVALRAELSDSARRRRPMAADHDERTPAEELRDAERRLDGLIRFCEESVDDDGDLLVEAHLLAADLETIRGCVRAALSGSSERERLR